MMAILRAVFSRLGAVVFLAVLSLAALPGAAVAQQILSGPQAITWLQANGYIGPADNMATAKLHEFMNAPHSEPGYAGLMGVAANTNDLLAGPILDITIIVKPGPIPIGCFKDAGDPNGHTGRDLDAPVCDLTVDNLTPQWCIDHCRAHGYAYAGVQYARQCFCGNSYGNVPGSATCDTPCSGDPAQICGGTWANLVYSTQ